MNAPLHLRLFVGWALLCGVACEPPAPRPPESVFVGEPSAASALVPASSAATASDEATCACNKNKPPGVQGKGTASTTWGPTVAYNGPLAGDVGPSMVEQRIRDAGGVPLRLTPQNQHLLASAHALVLVGGDDIDPKRYGERAHDKTRLLSPERESFDFALIETATNLRLPVLGICLGAQELWVAARGTLIQDIPSEIGTKVNHRAKEALHPVSLVPGTKLASIYGSNPLHVFSNHHQAVDAQRAAPSNFVVAATSSDGVAEAFESGVDQPTFVLGLGWHPEKRDQERVLFESLVAQARATQRQASQPAHVH